MSISKVMSVSVKLRKLEAPTDVLYLLLCQNEELETWVIGQTGNKQAYGLYELDPEFLNGIKIALQHHNHCSALPERHLRWITLIK